MLNISTAYSKIFCSIKIVFLCSQKSFAKLTLLQIYNIYKIVISSISASSYRQQLKNEEVFYKLLKYSYTEMSKFQFLMGNYK